MRLLFIVLFCSISLCLKAQISVYNQNINTSVQALQGKGVNISNITHNCNTNSGQSPHAFFDDPFGILGIKKGLVLTTGSAQNVLGPNDSKNQSQDNNKPGYDSDLVTIENSGDKLYDVCLVEFDVEVASEELRFNYVFGSEEYPEYVNQGFNDVFGFFITGNFGSGFIETKNLATVPTNGISSDVSVDNINEFTNSQYYINNGTGSTPYSNPFIQYDGYTRPLVAKTYVDPCEKYHIKLAIADVGDGIYDSGVFIEEGSFTSESPVNVEVSFDSERLESSVEGCNDGYFTLVRANEDLIQEDQIYTVEFSGSAVSGIDYKPIEQGQVVIPAGSMKSAPIKITSFQDSIDEFDETILLSVKNQFCPNFPPIASGEMPIKDFFEPEIQDERICYKEGKLLNTSANTDLETYSWTESASLSECLECPSPLANPIETDTFLVLVTDRQSGCKGVDSVVVFVHEVEAAFTTGKNLEYTSLDVEFINKSKGATSYLWSFGDGQTSNSRNPIHFYPFENIGDEETKEFKTTLVATHDKFNCKDTTEVIFELTNDFFIPNVITPNDDLVNDEFIINGITPGIWDLTIHNRFGDQVFFTSGYLNNWRGFNTIDGLEDKAKKLSDGTYFFLLENPNKDRTFKGWLQVIR